MSEDRNRGAVLSRMQGHHGCDFGEMIVMRIAVTYENGQIFQHFGRTEQFKLYDVEDGVVTSYEVVGTGGRGHGELINVLRELGVKVLICGGLGGGARNGLMMSGVEVCSGNEGDADAAVSAYVSGTLSRCSDPTCNHHGEDHVCTCGKH